LRDTADTRHRLTDGLRNGFLLRNGNNRHHVWSVYVGG